MFERKKLNNLFEGAVNPSKIIGNVYFVGCIPASSHLIDTGEGLILIDTGYMDTLFMLIDSIYRLGFSPYDIKYIIHSHWHGDHTASTKALAFLTDAKTMIGEKDRHVHIRLRTPAQQPAVFKRKVTAFRHFKTAASAAMSLPQDDTVVHKKISVVRIV